MARCFSCGSTDNRTGARYCMACGARLSFLAPGEILYGRYKILQVLGKGGMGAVCLAQDLGALGSKCVVKEMIDYFDPRDPDAVRQAQQRFESEARTLAALNHPSIPKITGYFTENGRNYMVMTYVAGENLEQRLLREGKPLSPDEAVPYAVQVCHILEYLSQRQPPVIHHDIKPSNIIVNRETRSLSLVDFGSARTRVLPGAAAGQGDASVFGTPGYAPPEQYGTSPHTEERSDVYALAATLYHLLTNDHPGDHPMQFPLLDQTPPPIRAVLQRALHPDVRQRLTAAQMRTELERFLAVGAAAQPFVFPSGLQANSPEELARLCDRHWEEAKRLLAQGAFESWLRLSLFRGDLARHAQQLAAQPDLDLALEQFLHTLDPHLPPMQPHVDLAQIDFGQLPPRKIAHRYLRISNQTPRGHFCGRIRVDPPVSWLSVEPTAFSGSPAIVHVRADTSGQPQGVALNATIRIESPTSAPATVLVQARVPLSWSRLLWSLIGAALGGGAIGVLAGFSFAAPVTAPALLSWGLFSLGAAAALAIALFAGSGLGGPHGFSIAGFALSLILALPTVSYLALIAADQWQSLRAIGGETVATLGLGALGALGFSILGLFRGLSKLGRRRLRWAAPLLLIIVCLGGIALLPQVQLAVDRTYWLDLTDAHATLRSVLNHRWQWLADRIPPVRLRIAIPYLVVDGALLGRIVQVLHELTALVSTWGR
jgi:serine/threonine protein kinase